MKPMRIIRILVALALSAGLGGCETAEQEFPDQIPGIKQSLGVFYQAVLTGRRAPLDSISHDTQVFDAVRHVMAGDSLAILSRRIHNPIDSAHIVMTVATVTRDGAEIRDRHQLELFMRREGDAFWIVGHRLTHSPP
jgi:hypothetical protein